MKLVGNILTTLLTRLTILALALVSSMLMARLLGPEGIGLFALVLLVPDLLRNFGLFGMDQANVVYAGLEPESRRALVWQSIIVAGVLGSTIALAGIAFFVLGAPGSQRLVHGPLWLYLLPLAIVPGALLADCWGSIIRGMNHIVLLNALDVGTKVASLALVVAFVGWLRLNVSGAVWAGTIVDVAAVLMMAFLLRRLKIWGKPSFDWSLWKRTARLALPAHLSSIMSYLNYRVDQFIIAMLLPPAEIGYYVLAVGLAERLWILTGAVAGPLLPHLTNSPTRDPSLAAVVARHVLVWTGAACLIVFVFSDMLVRLLYSSEFSPTVAPLRWLLPGIFTFSVGKVLVAELLARKKIMHAVWVSTLSTALNIIGNLILIPLMGIAGAALASTLSYSFASAVVIGCYLRETGVPWNALVPRIRDLQVYLSFSQRAVTCAGMIRKSGPEELTDRRGPKHA